MEIVKEKNNNIIVSNIKGGFGNQLFQYATGLAIAKKNNAEYKLDLDFYTIEKFKNAFRLHLLNINFKIAQPEEYQNLKNANSQQSLFYKVINRLKIHNKYSRKTHIKDTLDFSPSKKIINATAPVYIEGWCVKEIYFRNIREYLLEIYSPKDPFSITANIRLEKIATSNSVSIHIRRGDYIGNDTFEIVSMEYYIKAIDEINRRVVNPEFFIFTDDHIWAKANIKASNTINFINLKADKDYIGNDDIEDFFLMKNCKHNIIANSSYSWWPAYLNENPEKIVIAPQKWYKDSFFQNSIENDSFLPEDWIKL